LLVAVLPREPLGRRGLQPVALLHLLRGVLPRRRASEQHDGRGRDGDGRGRDHEPRRALARRVRAYGERDRHRALRRAADRPGRPRADPRGGAGDRGRARLGRASRADEGMTGRTERIAAVGYDYEARATEAVEACNLCGGTDLAMLARRDRYGYAATLRMCRR